MKKKDNTKGLSHDLLTWFANGSKGASSEAMAFAAAEVKMTGLENHPFDPSDLNRCLLLLDQVPEVRNHFDKIGASSAVWKRFIDNWGELESTFLEEAGLNWSKDRSAPKTYELMKNIRQKD